MGNELYQPPLPRNEDGTIKNVREYQPCAGGHKIDGKTPILQDTHLDQRLCDCGRMKYVSEECGCTIKVFELHGYPNQ